MATKKTKNIFSVEADGSKESVREALGITSERAEELDSLAHEAFDLEKKTGGMQLIAENVKTANEYALAAFHHGELHGRFSEKVENSGKKEIETLLEAVFSKRCKSLSTVLIDALFPVGMTLWVVWMIIEIVLTLQRFN